MDLTIGDIYIYIVRIYIVTFDMHYIYIYTLDAARLFLTRARRGPPRVHRDMGAHTSERERV